MKSQSFWLKTETQPNSSLLIAGELDTKVSTLRSQLEGKLQSLEDTVTDTLAAYTAQSVQDHEQVISRCSQLVEGFSGDFQQRIACLGYTLSQHCSAAELEEHFIKLERELEVYRLQDANVAKVLGCVTAHRSREEIRNSSNSSGKYTAV